MIKMPLFGKSQKSPAEVVKALKEAMTSLEKGDKKVEKVSSSSVIISLIRKQKQLFTCECRRKRM